MDSAPNLETGEEEGQNRPRPNVFQRAEGHIQRKTLDGLFELVPLLATVVVLQFFISHTNSFFRSLPFISDQIKDFPGIGPIVSVVVFYLVGLLISAKTGRKVMEFKDAVLGYVPVVRTIFGVTRQAMSSLTSQYQFTRVVFVEWPREGMVAMGFVTGRAYARNTSESIVVVYIPTVPNPTSGNMALILEDDLIETDLTVEDAMKLVFSGGIVLPQAISLERVPVVRSDFKLIGRFETDPE